jgi:enamine deaminase RidA (YjgF/YER057c/UK114 family)
MTSETGRFTATRNGNRVGFGSAFEERFGYCRAIRIGDTVYVGGMTATANDGSIIGEDLYAQMKVCYEKIAVALAAHGASMRDVVKETIYLKDFSQAEGMQRAHYETFADIRPVSTGIAINAFLTDDMLVEIEVTAVVGNLDG